MSELATMAALKITNSINQHYQQQNQEPLTPVQSHTPNMPFSAQSPQSDSSSVTTTNNNFTVTTNTNTNNTNTTNSMTTNPESPDASLTDETLSLSRQASVDAPPSSSNDYEDCAIHENNHTMSSSTSGNFFVIFVLCFFLLDLFWILLHVLGTDNSLKNRRFAEIIDFHNSYKCIY